MENWKDLLKSSKYEISLADHISYVTLPVVKDKKVFLTIFLHLKKSLEFAIKAYLLKQKEEKKIRMIPSSSELLWELFFEMFEIDEFGKKNVKEIKEIAEACEKSQLELKRGENYFVILPNFKTVWLTEEKARQFLNITKKFISKIERCIMK